MAYISAKGLSITARIVFSLILVFAFVWCGFAFWFQLPGGIFVFFAVITLWVCLGLIIVIGEWREKWRWKTHFLALFLFVAFAGWWSTIRPSLDLEWDPALSRTVTGTVDGHLAYLKNIRDFNWVTPEEGTPHWFSAIYDLDTISGVDVYASYWMGPWISHTLIGFNFADGRHLVFSAEIRRQKGEEFSAIGGFFKKFNLALIAATEEDIIMLRTNIRKEDVFRYPLKISQEAAKELFSLYLKVGNDLALKPRFYNTLTTNCTTVVFKMARVLNPLIPVDWRILVSGKLAGYLYDNGFINTDLPLMETEQSAHIGHEAEGAREGYSERIRKNAL